jgi:hypothetical protein
MAMTTINDIFKTYAHEYIRLFGKSMPSEHLKVVNAIINCRNGHYGYTIYKCEKCGRKHTVYSSCGNRHCPSCQQLKAHLWLTKQIERQLPGHHFMITFTVPSELRLFIRSHQRICYSALFKASSDTLKKLVTDEKFIGGDLPGFFGVLHTWGRELTYHPHIHYIVPGGAFSKDDGLWHSSRVDFFLPVEAISKIFKAKFRDELKKHNLYHGIPQEIWNRDWVVNSQAVGSSAKSVKYLAPYVFKVAISNSRIIKVEDHKVFFKYKKSKSNRYRTMILDVIEFMRRFLQHVLPSGFMKVRYYGFLSPGSSVKLEKIRALIQLSFGFKITMPEVKIRPFNPPSCSLCGGKLIFLLSVSRFTRIRSATG